MCAFRLYSGNTGDLPTNKNHLVYKWDKANILFSVTRKGNAAVAHFACHKTGLRKLKKAIDEFCESCFMLFPWCEMVIGVIKLPSVVRIARKCGFGLAATKKGLTVMVRQRGA